MPAVYAHDRFGLQVSNAVPEELGDIIDKYYTQYAIGLQGPDIFFFFRAWGMNKVREYGDHLHEIPARKLFEHAVSVVKRVGRDTPEYAYALGVICHFALDSECHPYVEMVVEETGVQHLEVEAEFEKYLLRLDHEDPVGFPCAELIPDTMETAEAIAPFYAKQVTPALVRACLKYMKLVKRIFTAPGALKQGIINGIMKRMGCYEKMNGLMNQLQDNPKCEESNVGLHMLSEQAVGIAVSLMESFDESVRGEVPLSKRFDRTFS